MQFSKLWYLQRFNLFQEFTRQELTSVAHLIDSQEFEWHEHLYQAGDPADQVYLLMEGRVKLYRRGPSGRKVTLAFLSPGEVFGDLALNGDGLHEQGAQTAVPSTIYAMPAEGFRALLSQRPTLGLRVIRRLRRQERILERKIASLVFKTVSERLAEALVALGDEYGQACRHGHALDLEVSQQELADLIGATRQVVNTTLKQFHQAGLVALRRRLICLIDRPGLQAAAGPSETRN
jgi:CRP-like cAMP-binding protein